MEVSGFEGNFRSSCESVMHVLRENRDSLMAMLEAFVYDPLICWRLLAPTNSANTASTTATQTPSNSRQSISNGDSSNIASSTGTVVQGKATDNPSSSNMSKDSVRIGATDSLVKSQGLVASVE